MKDNEPIVELTWSAGFPGVCRVEKYGEVRRQREALA
jgi:hypothetical protein